MEQLARHAREPALDNGDIVDWNPAYTWLVIGLRLGSTDSFRHLGGSPEGVAASPLGAGGHIHETVLV